MFFAIPHCPALSLSLVPLPLFLLYQTIAFAVNFAVSLTNLMGRFKLRVQSSACLLTYSVTCFMTHHAGGQVSSCTYGSICLQDHRGRNGTAGGSCSSCTSSKQRHQHACGPWNQLRATSNGHITSFVGPVQLRDVYRHDNTQMFACPECVSSL